jgi:diguanylate cyclase (GGDEF)-like protein/PAS domain S-box-containing protein
MPKKILIIDDSRTILSVFKRELKGRVDIEAVYVSSYNEALATIKEGDFFVAIVDLELDDCKSGEAVELTLSHGIPTIVFTATINSEAREEMIQKPIVDYVVKSGLKATQEAILLVESLLMLQGYRALVVDDSEVSIKKIATLFNTLTIETAKCKTPDEALALLRKDSNFQIVCVDYEMPQMNGAELILKIKSSIEFQKEPIIFAATGVGDKHSIFSLLKSGAKSVFQKPLLKEEFNHKVLSSIRLRAQRHEISEYVKTVDSYVITSESDLEGRIIYASRAFCEISGYEKEELLGQSHSILRHPDMSDSIYRDLWSTIKSGKSWSGEIKNRKKDGGFYWVKVNIDPKINTIGEVVGYRAIRQDITDKKEVELMAITDRLTQIYNRIHLDIVLNKEIEESKKYGLPFSIILLDIDKFKSVNDTYGHQVGDSVLKESAKVLSSSVEDSDTLGRWGGEEFLIIASGKEIDEAKALAENLRCSMESYEFSVVGRKTGSFGVSTYRAGDSEESLLQRADEALYRAKENGRNRVEVG